jgi:V/A-type H+-transporting ATPase subunit A
MIKAILTYFDLSTEALHEGAPINELLSLPVRERIGRFKYCAENDIDKEYDAIILQLKSEIASSMKGGED